MSHVSGDDNQTLQIEKFGRGEVPNDKNSPVQISDDLNKLFRIG